MRGNRYARGFDVMKTRKERKKERDRRISKTGRVQRLKTHLGKLKGRKDKKQKGDHTTALMESYIVRRKAERKAERKKEKEVEAKKVAAEEEQNKGKVAAGAGQSSGKGARKAKAEPVKKATPSVNKNRIQTRSLY